MKTGMWWRRQMALLDFCLASLLRRKIRNGALLTGYALIVFMLASVLFFAGALRKEATSVLQGAPEIIVQRMVTGRYMPIPTAYQEVIRTIRGVRKVLPRYWGYYFHPAAKANYTVIAENTFQRDPGRAEIGMGVARTWEVEIGAPLFLRTYDGRVISLAVDALLPEDTELVSADLIIVHPDDFKDLFGLQSDLATDLSISVRNPNEVQTIAEKINLRLPDTRVVLREDLLRTYAALFDWRSGYVLVMLSGAVMAFFIFALDKATGLSAAERTEIGILKAVGWDTADVLALKVYEGLAVSMTAFLAGVLGAYLHVFQSRGVLFENAIKGWSVLYPQLNLMPAVDPFQLASVLGLTVLPYTLLTIIPAWRAAAADPDAVLRRL